MSTWTVAEVNALKEKNGGGNKCGRAKWYANMTPADEAKLIPKENDPLPKYKELIHAVYERKLFYDASGASGIARKQTKSGGAAKVLPKRKLPQKKPMKKVEQKPVVEGDLIDFGFSGDATPAAEAPVQAFELDPFAPTNGTNGTPPLLQTVSASTPSLGPRQASGGIRHAHSAPSTGVGTGGGLQQNNFFDPFATSGIQPSVSQVPQKPIMNHGQSSLVDPFAALHMKPASNVSQRQARIPQVQVQQRQHQQMQTQNNAHFMGAALAPGPMQPTASMRPQSSVHDPFAGLQ